MRIIAEFVGGELDGRLEVLPAEVCDPDNLPHCFAVPNIRESMMLNEKIAHMLGIEVEMAVIEVSHTHYVRHYTPKAVVDGDIYIFVFELGDHDDDSH